MAIILMGKRELVALLNLSSWCLVMVERLFLAVPWGCLWFDIVVFPAHTHLLFLVTKVPFDRYHLFLDRIQLCFDKRCRLSKSIFIIQHIAYSYIKCQNHA